MYYARDLRYILTILAVAGVCTHAAVFTGVVRSAEGGPIPGAAIRVPDTGTGVVADSTGQFSLSLPPGSHTLVAASLGFQPDTITVASPNTPVAFTLSPAALVMAPVTVAADRMAGTSDASAFVDVIRTSELPSPTIDVPEVLDEVVGVQVREMGGHGSFSTISIRGSSSEQVRVYLDGIPLNQALGGGVNLALIPASIVERVEVYRGVVPPQFGGSGSAGVVNFETHTPDDSVKWRTTASYGSWNTRTLAGWLSGRSGPVGMTAAVDYSHSDNDYRYLDDNGTSYNTDDDEWATRTNNQFSSVNVMARLSSTPSSPIRWVGSYSYLYSDDHLPGNSTLHELESNSSLRTDQHLLQGRVAGSLPLLSDGDVQIWRSFRRDQFDDREGVVGLARNYTDDSTSSWGARLSLGTLLVPMNRFAVDASLQYEEFQPGDRLLADDTQRASVLIPSRRDQYTAYLSDEFTIDRWGLSLNGQIGTHHVVSRVSHNDSDIGYSITRDTTRITEWPRSLGLGWNISPGIEARANWGRYVRVPNLYEMFGDRGSTIGNADLKPETGTNRDIGVQVSGPVPWAHVTHGTAEIVYFHNTVDDAIVFWEVYSRMRPFNLGSVRIRGVELSSAIETDFNIGLSGNLTLQEPLNTSDGTYHGNDLPNQPRVQGDLRTEYRYSRYTLFYALHGHSHFYGQPYNALGDEISAGYLHDVGLTVRLTPWMDVTMEGRNLSDVREFHSRYVPLPGRSWSLSIQAHSL